MNQVRKLAAFATLATGAFSCGGEIDVPLDMDEPVRLETRAATFIVRHALVDDLAQLLAGEPTRHVYFAGGE